MKTKVALSALALLPVMGAMASADSYGVINYEFVNIRVNPSMNTAVKFVLKKGDKVQIISEKDGWTNIKFNGKTGWVQSNAVGNDIPSRFVKTSAASYRFVSRDKTSLRVSSSTSSNVLKELKKGTKVKVISESVSWAKVMVGNQSGFISTSSLTDSLTKSKYKLVTSNNLNARSFTNISSSKVFSLKQNDLVEFISEANGWAKIKFNNKVGYVSSFYLKDAPNDKIPENTTIEDVGLEIKDINNADKLSTKGGVKYVDMNISLTDMVNTEMANSLNTIHDGKQWRKVSSDELQSYMDPNNFTDSVGMMQFAKLDKYTEDITPRQLDNFLLDVCGPNSVFTNQGQAFINAARKNNINVLYLVAHSMIETANGKSKLSSGISVNGSTVYNFFGIGAVDGNALKGGAETAYKNGWTSVAAGIDGAAKWISSKYIHNNKYGQHTLYSMKWSKDFMWHQYASDIRWPSHIASRMNDIAKYSDRTGTMSYLVPRYR